LSELIRAAGKIWVFAVLLAGLWCASAQALTLQSIGSFEEPIYVTSAPDNPEQLFVVERPGRIIKVENGTRTVFADLRSLVNDAGEGGLLSIALSPDFQTSGRLYVYYTGKKEAPAEIHVEEMIAGGGTVPLSSRREIFEFPHPNHSNHYGGQLQIGPEGRLFVSTGDGGGGNDVENNAQDLSSPLGKILRVKPGTEDGVVYDTLDGNPFLETPGAFPPVWSYGLRNPFRFSFDRLTGALLIGDVGQDVREEVDYSPAPEPGKGDNYGWNCREGFQTGTVPPEPGCASAGPFTDPIFDYPNPDPGCAAIIGGYVARNANYGDLYGRYLYSDNCTGQIRSLLPSLPFAGGDRSEGLEVAGIDSFGEDSCGRLYAVSGAGPVYRLVGPGGGSCTPQAQQPELKRSFLGIRALRRKVKRNKHAFITAFVSPCDGRRGQPVSLWEGRRRVGTRHLDRVCSVRFRPRIEHRVRFRATVKSDGTYAEAVSRRLKIRILRRHR
jgi:hypothetical protein